MNNSKIVELLKVLKKIYVCEMCGFNESFDLVQDTNISDLNQFLEENGVKTLEVIESCLNVRNVMNEDFIDSGCEKTAEGVKKFFYNHEGLELSDNEARGIYEKYLKNE